MRFITLFVILFTGDVTILETIVLLHFLHASFPVYIKLQLLPFVNKLLPSVTLISERR